MNDLIPLLYIAAVIVAIFVVYTIYRNSIDNGKKLDLILKRKRTITNRNDTLMPWMPREGIHGISYISFLNNNPELISVN